jgi:hypothetical protein
MIPHGLLGGKDRASRQLTGGKSIDDLPPKVAWGNLGVYFLESQEKSSDPFRFLTRSAIHLGIYPALMSSHPEFLPCSAQ